MKKLVEKVKREGKRCLVFSTYLPIFFCTPDQLDFLSAIEPVRFEAVGETNFSSPHTSCAFFAILDDKIAFEGEEGFVVGIQAPSGAEYQIGTNSTANVTILDNDGK